MTNKFDPILDAYREDDATNLVTSFNTLTGAVTLAAGTNITLTPVGNTITITAQNDSTAVWGSITGTLSNQTDLQAVLDAKLTQAVADTLYAAVLTSDQNYVSDAQLVVIGNTSGTNTGDNTNFAPPLGADDNYVTDAQLVVLGNTSGTNTGDNATNTQYSGLAASKADVGQTFYIGTTQVAINRASAALTLAGITLTTPDIGTPSAGVLTNATGLPAASVVAGVLGVTGTRMTKLWATDIESTNMPTVGGTAILTSLTAPQFTTIELGAASDTTLSRVSAGVIAVEGVTVPTISSTSTLTAKRINPRLVTAASYTTDTGTSLDVSTCDQFEVTAQAGALLFNSPSGTPLGGQKLIIRIKDNGTARALTYNAIFRAMGNALPTTTVLSKTLYMGFIYNATDTKWDLVASAQEA